MRHRFASRVACSIAALALSACGTSPTEPGPTTGRYGTLVLDVKVQNPACIGFFPGVGIYVDGEFKAAVRETSEFRFDLPGGWHVVGFFSPSSTSRVFVPEGGTAAASLAIAGSCG